MKKFLTSGVLVSVASMFFVGTNLSAREYGDVEPDPHSNDFEWVCKYQQHGTLLSHETEVYDRQVVCPDKSPKYAKAVYHQHDLHDSVDCTLYKFAGFEPKR